MRLVCPNCGAQYEVDDALIPAEGRDVQCSDCGHAWYFSPVPASADAAPQAQDLPAPKPPEPQPPPRTAAARPVPPSASTVAPLPARPQGTPQSPDTPSADSAADAAAGTDPKVRLPDRAPATPSPSIAASPPLRETAGQPAPAAATPPPRRQDASVLGVLREEAAYESDRRKREAGALESQPDLGLAQGARTTPRSGARPDDDTGSRAAPGDAGSEHSLEVAQSTDAQRRHGLPDIDDISSTLQPVAQRRAAGKSGEPPVQAEDPERQSFVSGLAAVIGALAVLTGLYLVAPPLAARFPVLEPPLQAYVLTVDHIRVWLSATVDQALAALTRILRQSD